jgi:hypothetical protein
VPQFEFPCDTSNAGDAEAGMSIGMAPVLFRCPNMGVPVRGWFADGGSEDGDEAYQSVTCLACQQVHLVNPKSGKVLGGDKT